MVTPMTLQDSLNAFLKREVALKHTLKAVDRNGFECHRHPQVIGSGWILPRSVDEDDWEGEEFPYIMTRIAKVEHLKGGREAVVHMLIFFGVYDPGVYDENGRLINDGSGYRDLWNLMETTRQAICQNLTIDNKYRAFDDFFEAETLEEQPYPYWEGYCKSKWHIAYPAPTLDKSFYKKGD